MWRALLCLTLLAGATLAQAASLDAEAEAGRRLFREGVSPSGAQVSARVGGSDMVLPGDALPCGSCHGRDGRGRPEGGVRPPDIRWQRLASADSEVNGRRHGGYTDASFMRALSQGVDPAGNRLDSAMPRFVMSSADQLRLLAYLKALDQDQDPGIAASQLRLGSLLPDTGAGAILRAVLGDAVQRINQAGGIHGRQLQLEILDPGPDAASARAALSRLLDGEGVFAVLSPMAPALGAELSERLAQAQMPVLSIQPMDDDANAPGRFSVLPTPAVLWQALAGHAQRHWQAEQGPTLLAYTDAPGQREEAQATAQRLRAAGWQQVQEVPAAQAAGAPRTLLFFGEPQALPGLAARVSRPPEGVLTLASLGPVLAQLPDSWSGRLLMAFPFVPGDATAQGREALAALRQRQGLGGQGAGVQVSAWCLTTLLEESLKRSGRTLSRERWLAELERLQDVATGLTPPIRFGPGQHQGLAGAHVVAVSLPQRQFTPVSAFVRGDP